MQPGLDIEDAREALAYWEARAQRLPRRAVRQRREAVALARRWRARVAEEERAQYGRGLLGVLSLVIAEGRLPASARHTGRRIARRSKQLALGLAVVTLLIAVASVVALVEMLQALI